MSIDKRAARLSTLAFVGVSLVSILSIRLWFLQSVDAPNLQADVTAASTVTVRIPPERGRIFDSDGRILADNQRILTVALDWQQLRDPERRNILFTRLSGWLDVPVETMEAEYKSDRYSPFLPFPVKRGVDEETANAIRERIEDFPGVEIETEWRRVYPYAPHASHVVGYMGAITSGQLEEFTNLGYLANERVGQFGVEKSLENLLHGEWGYQVIEVDARNRPIRVLEDRKPVKGFDVQLTIDLDLQQYVEGAIQTTLRARREIKADNPIRRDPITGKIGRMDPNMTSQVPFKAPAGSAVVQNYLTGEIIAMASYPDFDNRWFEAGLSSKKFEQIFPTTDKFGNPINPDESILVNRATQGRYNLGSTFKPFTAFAALSSGLLTPNSFYYDSGIYKLETVDKSRCDAGVRCTYKNATCANGKPCVYGSVNVESALAVSSDAFFYRIGELIMNGEYTGTSILQDTVEKFGFGRKTGIELPFEFTGTVPDAKLKKEYADLGVIREDEGRGYFTGDNVQLAIGQGLLSATPLQLANGYATIANGGFVLQPTIIKQIFKPGTLDSDQVGFADVVNAVPYDDPDHPPAPIVVSQIKMEPEQRRVIVRGLRRVVTGPGANGRTTTGEEVFFDTGRWNIQIAGKTGTAQGFGNYPWNDSSVFAAFATDGGTGMNRDNPYVVAAYMEKSGYGSTAAAPLVKCVYSVLSGLQATRPVEISDPLDITSTDASIVQEQPNPEACWKRSDAPSSVRYGVHQVD